MKKSNRFLVIAFTAAIAMSSASLFAVGATDDASSANLPDINMDSVVDISDVTALQKYIADYDITVNIENADLDGNGSIDIYDATYLQRALLELSEETSDTTTDSSSTEETSDTTDDSGSDNIPKETEDIGGLI